MEKKKRRESYINRIQSTIWPRTELNFSPSSEENHCIHYDNSIGNTSTTVDLVDEVNIEIYLSDKKRFQDQEMVNHLTNERITFLFQKTRNLIKMGPSFKLFSFIYSERKMLLTMILHVVLTITIWMHFSIIKFRTQEGNVPFEANRYLWKVYTPTLEFGSMHSILFQMALLPLTMSRLSISKLSTTDGLLARLIPFNRAMEFHTFLGYLMITTVIIATLVFFIFFGLLCYDGEVSERRFYSYSFA